MSSRRGRGNGKSSSAGGGDAETTRLVMGGRASGGATFTTTSPQQQQQHAHIQAFYQQQYHQEQQQQQGTDPLERMIKRALLGFALFLGFTFLGVLLLVLKGLGFDKMSGLARLPPAATSYWAIFAPFWVADFVGWVVVARTLTGTCSLRTRGVRDDRRHMARLTAKEAQNTISIEMFPLVQIVVRALLISTPFLICVTAAQILLALSLQGGEKPQVPLWLALLPLIIWEALALLSTWCLRTGSFPKALGWFLVLLSTLTLGLRFSIPPPQLPDMAWPLAGDEAPLWLAFTPFWALQTLLLFTLLYVALQACCARRLRLTSQHVACLVLYAGSLALLTLASVLVAWRHDAWEAVLDHALRFQNFSETLTGIALFCGVGLAELGLYLVAAEEAEYLITSHGYEDPMPLSRTARGWEPTGARVSNWFLLGRVEETARLMRRGGVAGAVGSAAGAAGRRMAGAAKGALRESPLRGGRAGGSGEGGGEPLRRSNSGSYADLYDDL